MADIDNLIRYLNQEAEAQEDYARRAGDMDAYTNAARARARATRLEHMAETAVQLRADRDRLAAEVARLRAALAELRGLFAGTPGGEYAICRDDGNKLWIADDINISGVMERVDAALGEQEA